MLRGQWLWYILGLGLILLSFSLPSGLVNQLLFLTIFKPSAHFKASPLFSHSMTAYYTALTLETSVSGASKGADSKPGLQSMIFMAPMGLKLSGY